MKSILATAVLLQTVPVVETPVPPAPPIVRVVTPKMEAFVAGFLPGEARCGGLLQSPVATENPLPAGFLLPTATISSRKLPTSLGLSFDLAEDGRPVNIRMPGPDSVYPLNVRDVVPAFAAWRFTPGAKREGCELQFKVDTRPVAAADPKLLYEYLALQRPGAPGFNQAVGKAALERLTPPGSNCVGYRAGIREQHHPAFEEVAQSAGTASYTFLAFDIAADGSAHNVRVTSSDGNRDLDSRSVAALGKWRFAPGAKTGCVYSYSWRKDEVVSAAVPPARSAFRPTGSTCVKDIPKWLHMPDLVFPAAFNRRLIEGWAVIGFDVAPWGETGNVKVLASYPAAEFGEQASDIITRAKKPASKSGYSGCVDLLQFRIAPRGAKPRSEAPGVIEGQ